MAVDLSRTFTPINIALLTVSDTRTSENDTSGDILAERIQRGMPLWHPEDSTDIPNGELVTSE